MRPQSYVFAFLVLVCALAAVGGGVYLFLTVRKAPPLIVNSFEECKNAGLPILETVPPQCRTPDGRTFTGKVVIQTPDGESVSTTTAPLPSTATDTPSVTSPLPYAKIKSPMIVTGSVVGTWYFEASFPVILKDANGKILIETTAKALSDWMTTSTVPFSANLTFATSTASSGVLILKKDNPSGLPEKDKQIEIPVTF